MAESLTAPSLPNVTLGTRQAAMREVADLKKMHATATAKLRNGYKRWDKQGVTSTSINHMLAARDKDPDALMAELKEQFQSLYAAGATIEQADLFPETAPKLKKQEISEHMEWEAGETGWRAGLNGVPFDDNPFPAGRVMYVKWVERWHDGQAALVERTFGEKKPKKDKAGATDTKVASAGRKRPDIKPDTVEDVPSETARPDPDEEAFA